MAGGVKLLCSPVVQQQILLQAEQTVAWVGVVFYFLLGSLMLGSCCIFVEGYHASLRLMCATYCESQLKLNA